MRITPRVQLHQLTKFRLRRHLIDYLYINHDIMRDIPLAKSAKLLLLIKIGNDGHGYGLIAWILVQGKSAGA